MGRSSKKREPIPPHFTSLEEAAVFWDDHDLTEYWDVTQEETVSGILRAM